MSEASDITRNPISELNELKPRAKLQYIFSENGERFTCTVIVEKDGSKFKCRGYGARKQIAKENAAEKMVDLLKLASPMVPMSICDPCEVPICEYQQVDSLDVSDLTVPLNEIPLRGAKLYLQIDIQEKEYAICLNKPLKTTKISCPIELFNNIVQYTDWSMGPICDAQKNYIKLRVLHAVNYFKNSMKH